MRTFFMVLQWGRVHCLCSLLGCSLSLLEHLWAWRSNTSCCWISFLFSGSAECGAPGCMAPGAPLEVTTEPGDIWDRLLGTIC